MLVQNFERLRLCLHIVLPLHPCTLIITVAHGTNGQQKSGNELYLIPLVFPDKVSHQEACMPGALSITPLDLEVVELWAQTCSPVQSPGNNHLGLTLCRQLESLLIQLDC